ncbi:hypothetical protein AAEU42_06800 [Pseudoflavonifractor phocaeensis]|uniref:hypothetical protein n=1 Tax=Pseudoflavonifractor phocaeensis TaxID=1870988 RepID=UPI00313B37FA
MKARRWAAALALLLVCGLPARAGEEPPAGGETPPGEETFFPGGGLWPGGGEAGDGEEGPGGWEELPGGGIIWPGEWPPELGEGENPDPDPEGPVDPSAWADGTVETAGELCAWMRSLGPEGGEITLGATVTLDWEDSPFFGANLEKPAVIHTGPHSLVYDGKGIRVVGQEIGIFQIEGEGVDAPVLELRGDQFFGSDWNEVLAYQEVTATGRDGRGGVAVQVTSDSVVRNNLEYYETRGRIHAYGAGAVGLKLDVPARVNCLDIDVGGEGAVAIDGPEGTEAFLCALTAEAGGRPAGDGVDTDGSILDQEGEGPRIECRVGIDPQIPLGTRRRDIEPIVRLDDVQRYRLTNGNYIDVYLIYDDNYDRRLDTKLPGPVDIPVALPKALQGLGLEGEGGLTFRAWIRDPALPILTDVERAGDTLTFSTSDYFVKAGAVWDPETKLWRSNDGGETWSDATDAVTWLIRPAAVERFALDTAGLDHSISLVLENGAGWGNVVTLTPGEEGVLTPGTGGDRDGGDREEQPGGDGGTHGGGTGSGGSSDDREPKPTPTPKPTPAPRPTPGPEHTPGPTAAPTPQAAPAATAEAVPTHAPGTVSTPEVTPIPEASPISEETPAAEPSLSGAPEEPPALEPGTEDAPAGAPEVSQPPKASQNAVPSDGTDSSAVPVIAGAASPEPPAEDTQTPAPAPSAAGEPSPDPAGEGEGRPRSGRGLVLPAALLVSAGGVTSLVTLRKKRGGR